MKIRSKMTLVLIILASLLPGGLAIKQYLDQQKSEDENKIYQNNLLDQINRLKLDNESLNNKSDSLLDTNRKLSEQLTNETKETLKIVLGDGYAKVLPTVDNKQQLHFSLYNASKYPLYDITVFVENYNEIIKAKVEKKGDKVLIPKSQIRPFVTQLPEIPLLGVGTNITLNYTCPYQTPIYRFFRIMYKHSITMQYSIYQIIDGEWVFSYKIYEYNFKESSQEKLLEEGGHKYEDEVWEKNFYFRKYIETTGYTDDVVD